MPLNLINRHDIPWILSRLRRGGWGKALTRLRGGSATRVAESWQHVEAPPVNWWDVPAVRERWNRMISGNPAEDFAAYVAHQYLPPGQERSALSIACGAGGQELRWAKTGIFTRIDACDLSAPRIAAANAKAAAENLSKNLHFFVADAMEGVFPASSYDAVLSIGSLHHLSPIEKALDRIQKVLKPGGYFLLDEFVGPSRFQWTDAQLDAANELLAAFPSKLRKLWNSEEEKKIVYRPSRLRMRAIDPSEAVESEKILPLIKERFDVVECRPYGGNVLHILLSGIAHHFLDGADEEARKFLQKACEAEDVLLAGGGVQSDFVVMICRKR